MQLTTKIMILLCFKLFSKPLCGACRPDRGGWALPSSPRSPVARITHQYPVWQRRPVRRLAAPPVYHHVLFPAGARSHVPGLAVSHRAPIPSLKPRWPAPPTSTVLVHGRNDPCVHDGAAVTVIVTLPQRGQETRHRVREAGSRRGTRFRKRQDGVADTWALLASSSCTRLCRTRRTTPSGPRPSTQTR